MESACGTKQCDPPEPGSTRSGCDFNGFDGASFAGQNLSGSVFRRIDGRGTNFDGADLRGTIFAEACLRSASFRGARLGGSTWGGACLVDANFTGADLGGDSAVFAGGLFCCTVMPDGAVGNRDCGVDSALCRSSGGGIGPHPCATTADCPEAPCRTKACTAGACAYAPVGNGTDPSGQCAHCCGGECCVGRATSCNGEGRCCAPNCSLSNCGPDGCGGGGTCGTCPPELVCGEVLIGNQPVTRCLCTAESCANGCCADRETCVATCPAGEICKGGNCVCATAEACRPGEACIDNTCVCATSEACLPHQECVDHQCVCTPQSCPNGCCLKTGDCCSPNLCAFHCGLPGAPCNGCNPGQRCVDRRCV